MKGMPMENARIEQLKAFLANDPDDAQARFLLGYEYNKLKRYDDAVKVLLRCVEIKPDYAAGWKQLGDAYKRLGLATEALGAYERGAEAGKNIGNEHTAKECETLAARLRDKTG